MIVHPFLFVVINHSSIAVHNKNISCSDILFEIQTFLGGAFSLLFCIYRYVYCIYYLSIATFMLLFFYRIEQDEYLEKQISEGRIPLKDEKSCVIQ